MHTLRMLGGISLIDETGIEVDALLRQSKHIALLAYLASPKPGTWHKRDSILGTFWAENDQTRSRSALRSALYTVRRHLPDNAIRARGDNDLSVDPDVVTTDTARMADLFEQGEYERALGCYAGEFLPGIYIAEAEAFEQWLEHERRRTRSIASQSARRLSEKLEASNDLDGAIVAARRNYELDPDDEGTARRFIALLDAAGDRAQAFAVYEQFRDHLLEAFGVRPSAETVALLDAVRTRHEPGYVPAVTVPRAKPAAEEFVVPKAETRPKRPNPRRFIFLAIPLALAAMAWIVWPRREATPAATAGRLMVVLPVSNETGDPSLDYLTTGIGDDLARLLADAAGFSIRSAARSAWPPQVRSDMRRVATTYKAAFLLRTSITKAGDSLQIITSVIDGGDLQENPLSSHSFSQYTISDVESKVAADVAGAVFRRPLPPPLVRPINPESYALSMKGYHQLLFNLQISRGGSSGRDAANALFVQALDLDINNPRAWAGISSIWASETVSDQVPFDVGFDRATSAAEKALALDSTQGAALANLGALRALKARRVSAGEPLIKRAQMIEPWNPEVYLVKSALYRTAHMWNESRDAIRVARNLDPLNSRYVDREAILDFCADRPEAALAIFRAEPPFNPADGIVQGGITRALAMMQHYDEALDSWRTDARLQSDTLLLKALDGKSGKAGYWEVRHNIAKHKLAALETQPGRKSPLNRMQLFFASGDSARGFAALDSLVETRMLPLYRLSCMPDIDEFRNTPRFKAIAATIGGLPK